MILITVTSPATDAGKTMIATGLAEAAAARGYKTMFLDLDTPVGDAPRIFGIASQGAYPTLTSWISYQEPFEQCMRSVLGAYILPKPENPRERLTEGRVRSLLEALEQKFEMVIADLGSDFSNPAWRILIDRSDARLLVIDCDPKALARLEEFLYKLVGIIDWLLVINQREAKGYYTQRQMIRQLSHQGGVKDILIMPHIKDINGRIPRTFDVNHPLARHILGSACREQDTSGTVKERNHKPLNGRRTVFSLLKEHRPRKDVKARLLLLKPNSALIDLPPKCQVVDTSGVVSAELAEQYDDLWRADWRLFESACPARVNQVSFYAMTEILGPLDDHDAKRFIDFVEHLANKHSKDQVAIIDAGVFREELLRLGAVEGG